MHGRQIHSSKIDKLNDITPESHLAMRTCSYLELRPTRERNVGEIEVEKDVDNKAEEAELDKQPESCHQRHLPSTRLI